MVEKHSSEDGKTYIVPSDKEPTYWNREAAVGFMLGNLPGAAIGAYIGKEKMERDRQHGKTVEPATALNQTTIIGAGLGSMAGVLIGGLIGGIALGGSELAIQGMAALGSFGGMITGAIMGGDIGKERLAKEYAEAREYAEHHQRGHAHGKGHAQEYTVTPEQARELEAKLSAKRESKTEQFLRYANDDRDAGVAAAMTPSPG